MSFICNLKDTNNINCYISNQNLNSYMARITKANILEMRKQEIRLKIDRKFTKLTLRQKNPVTATQKADKIKKSWSSLIILFGVSNAVSNLIKNIKILKIRSARSLKWLVAVCKSLGIIKTKLNLAKKKCALRVFFNQKITKYTKYIKTWLKKRRAVNKNIVLNICEKCVYITYMDLFTHYWKFRVKFIQITKIQRWLHKVLAARKELYSSLIELWDEEEAEIQ